MNPWNYLQERVSAASFARGWLILAAAWLLVLYPALIWFSPGALPTLMAPTRHVDFYQYYGGAAAVHNGLWDFLYPVPPVEIYGQPSHFSPKYRTFLFNPAAAEREKAFYPELNLIPCAWSPKLKEAFPEVQSFGIEPPPSFIYPPPTALLCAPLALFSFDTASNRVWPVISVWFLFVLTYFSAQVHRLIRGAASYAEGVVILACLLFTTQGETGVHDGNVSPILGGCIACCAYALLRYHMPAFSCCYIVLILFKSIGLAWLPLLLLNRRYWSALVYLLIITLVLNGIVLSFGGIEVYKTFFSLAPLISIPVGVGVVETLLHNFGFFSAKLYLFTEAALIGILYYGLWKNRGADATQRPLFIAAFLAGTMAVFCLLNFIVWAAYCAVYLFIPFLGWMVCEIVAARGRWRMGILIGVALSFALLNGEGICSQLLGAKAESYYVFGVVRFYMMAIPVFVLVVSLRRLLFVGSEMSEELLPESRKEEAEYASLRSPTAV